MANLHQYYGRFLNGRRGDEVEDLLSLGFYVRVFVLTDVRVLHNLFTDGTAVTL